MLTMLCGSITYTVETAVESGCRVTAGYYVSKVLTPLYEWWRKRIGGDFGDLIVHADITRPTKPPCRSSSCPVTIW
jgi:hypothetical protein